MANKVTLKRSSVAGKVPQTSDLDFGEVALNFTDGRLYFRNSNDQIEFFETPSDASEFDVLSDDLNLGSVTGSVTQVLNLGSVTEAANDSYDLGRVVTSGIVFPNRFVLPSSTVSNLPSEGFAGEMRFVTDDASGAVPVFYDGSVWRRLSDNQSVAVAYIEDGYVEDGYV
jgi:cytochrome c-type biogenesis protein CcmE